MNIYKYRVMTSANLSDWKYICVDDSISNKDIGEYLNEKDLLPTWSEHYRSVEWKKTKTIPRKIVLSWIDCLKRSIKYEQKKLKQYKEILEACPPSAGSVEIITHISKTSNDNNYAIVIDTKTNKIIYRTKSKANMRQSAHKEMAQNWCSKKDYDVIKTEYKVID